MCPTAAYVCHTTAIFCAWSTFDGFSRIIEYWYIRSVGVVLKMEKGTAGN